MKNYPSITGNKVECFRAHIFDKLDGSNLRITWDKKREWNDFATRTRSIKTDHEIFGEGYKYFEDNLKEELEKIIKEKRWVKVDLFFEFYGESSFAGRHKEGEEKQMSLIDVCINNKAKLMSPEEYLEIFGHLNIPNYLGVMEWNDELIEKVYKGEIEGMGFEGIIGKGENIRAKAKTKKWKDKVIEIYHPDEAIRILQS